MTRQAVREDDSPPAQAGEPGSGAFISLATVVGDGAVSGTIEIMATLEPLGAWVAAVEVIASVEGGARLVGIRPGSLLGDDLLIAIDEVDESGLSGRLAFARKGGATGSPVSGPIALVRVEATTPAVDAVLRVNVLIADAEFALQGPFASRLVLP